MPKNFLDNGTILTLGLVGVVAAVGAVRKRGSATTIEPKSPDDRPGMYELVDKTPSLALWKKTYGKTYWLITDYEGNAQLPYGHQDDYPTVFKTLTRAMKVWNTLSTGGAVEVTNAQALRGLGFNQQEHGREQKGSRAKRASRRGLASSMKHEAASTELRDALNAHFGKSVFSPGYGYMSLRDQYQQPGTELVIEIRHDDAIIRVNIEDEEGNQQGSSELARFPVSDLDGIASFLRRYRPSVFK
jgi:hypothetical protein